MMLMMLMMSSTQDRRRGNPAWSWTHNHKEYPTGQFLPHLTLSCFCLLFLAKNIGKYKISPPCHNHRLSPERGLCWKNQLASFCVLYLWSVVMKCIASPSISHNSQSLTPSLSLAFLPNLSFFTFLYPLFVLHFPIWQARIAFLSANFISMSLFCIKCKTCHSWKLNWTF